MSEINSSLFLLVSEVGVVLILVLCGIIFMVKKRSMRDKALAIVLVDKIKNAEPSKREKLLSLLKGVYGYDDEKAEAKIDILIDREKTLYGNLLKIFLKKEREKISEFDDYLNKLIESYQSLNDGENGSNVQNEGESPKDSKLVLVREENTSLREANAKLKKDLDAAMQTMESMMSEYTSMYEGGKKDGEQRMKNEMFKLRQVLETKADDIDDVETNKEEIDLEQKDESER
ncbi:hypothetical protein MNBD_GAMMA24-2557 [hydrothermal vent metagenome]|uniref:Uncharacterized protein n=1 Tax=hydrothermal vent metagenome TaxID=652676 RepID=A0A3B1B4D2_9ZZZZ